MLQQLFGKRNDSGVKTMTVAELHSRLEANEQLIVVDVRSSEEYAYDGHIAGSRLLPLPMLSMRVGELPQDRPIACVCRSGNRSQVACEMLARQGFTNVYNVQGGLIAWQRSGFETHNG